MKLLSLKLFVEKHMVWYNVQPKEKYIVLEISKDI